MDNQYCEGRYEGAVKCPWGLLPVLHQGDIPRANGLYVRWQFDPYEYALTGDASIMKWMCLDCALEAAADA